jgi:hypothetical protein
MFSPELLRNEAAECRRGAIGGARRPREGLLVNMPLNTTLRGEGRNSLP